MIQCLQTLTKAGNMSELTYNVDGKGKSPQGFSLIPKIIKENFTLKVSLKTPTSTTCTLYMYVIPAITCRWVWLLRIHSTKLLLFTVTVCK